jgi:cyclic dehypoxanthinyl futalosine synthase
VHRIDIGRVLAELKDAGLDSVPGAGAEILVDEVRDRIAKKKIDTARWIEIHRAAHDQGLLSSATMMFGTGETRAQRVEHLIRVRDLQAESGGFTAFVPWTLQADGTEMQGTPETTAAEYLKTVAVSRIVIDNVPNVQVSYVTQGPKVAQIALHFGCNDFGSLMMEENVVSAAGTDFIMPKGDLVRAIEQAGFRPVARYQDYTPVDSALDWYCGCRVCLDRKAV